MPRRKLDKTIRISKELRDKIKAYKRYESETYDSIIESLIERAEKNKRIDF